MGAILERERTITKKPEPWAPPGWDMDVPCEMRFKADEWRGICPEPAAWAFAFACCGHVKRVCQKHWEYLNGPKGVTPDHGLACAGCQRAWSDFSEACARAWRL